MIYLKTCGWQWRFVTGAAWGPWWKLWYTVSEQGDRANVNHVLDGEEAYHCNRCLGDLDRRQFFWINHFNRPQSNRYINLVGERIYVWSYVLYVMYLIAYWVHTTLVVSHSLVIQKEFLLMLHLSREIGMLCFGQPSIFLLHLTLLSRHELLQILRLGQCLSEGPHLPLPLSRPSPSTPPPLLTDTPTITDLPLPIYQGHSTMMLFLLQGAGSQIPIGSTMWLFGTNTIQPRGREEVVIRTIQF